MRQQVEHTPKVLRKNILRLIHNARQEHATCCLARGRYGLADYGRLAHLLQEVSRDDLSYYLDEIDSVRVSHSRCLPCSLKFLAFCAVYCRDQLPERRRAYLQRYESDLGPLRGARDFIAEVRAVIRASKQATPIFITNVRFFRSWGNGSEGS